MPLEKPRGYRFGEFEVRLEDETLLRNGVALPIQKLPFQMLAFLLQYPGQVVSREELQNRLWSGQTYLQFENGLHVAAAKLREALGEQASSPIYIKTVPRMGYQFIGEAVALTDTPASTPLSREVDLVPKTSSAPSLQPLGISWKWIAYSAGALALVSAAVVVVYRSTHSAALDPQQKIMIGAVRNDTGNPELDGIFSVPFQLKLRESQYLNLVAAESPADSTKLLAKTSIADQLSSCVEKKAQVLLTGRLETHDEGYRVTLSALRCGNGQELTSQTDDAATQVNILSAIDLATEGLRRRLGEPESTLQRSNTPIAQATTSSMAALRAFAMGEARRAPATVNEAISSYKLATDLDPQFAIAYARLGISYSWRGDYALSKQALSRAFDLRNRATDRERLYIASRYYYNVTGEIPQAIQTYKLWQSLFPYDAEPRNSLAVTYNNDTGQSDKALQESTAAVALSPANVAYNTTLAQAHMYAGDYAYLDHQCVNPNAPALRAATFHELCYLSYFAQGDETGMTRELDGAKTPLQSAVLLDHAAWVAAAQGRVADSRALFQQTRKDAIRSQTPDFAAEILMEQAIVESELGLKEQAKQDALIAVSEDSLNQGTRGLGALVLANCGDTSGAQTMSAEATSQSPFDSILNFTILGSMRAVLALNAQNPKGALESLEDSRPYDFNTFTNLAPAYYRGLAYEKDGNWKSAAG